MDCDGEWCEPETRDETTGEPRTICTGKTKITIVNNNNNNGEKEKYGVTKRKQSESESRPTKKREKWNAFEESKRTNCTVYTE